MKKRIGIFGGTFNPLHYGHLIIAENACSQYDLEQVIFLPTGHTSYKPFMGESMSGHRCRMVELAIADNPRFSLSCREVESGDINYTFRTLKEYHDEYPQHELYFILGADSLSDFDRWMHPEEICRYATILAAVRDRLNEQMVDGLIRFLGEKYDARIYRLHTPNFNVSSRELRERIRRGETIRYMLPPQVEDYIFRHRLYMDEPTMSGRE